MDLIYRMTNDAGPIVRAQQITWERLAVKARLQPARRLGVGKLPFKDSWDCRGNWCADSCWRMWGCLYLVQIKERTFRSV